jgi:hypothetical protein
MIRNNQKKKGVTPLMAGLVLVSFAIAVGVVVMNLGRAEVEDGAQCPVNVELKFSVIGGKEQACYDQNKKEVYLILENGVNIKVDGLVINIVGKNKADSFEQNEAKIGKAGTYIVHQPYDQSVNGDVLQIKVVPKVVLDETEQICTEQALVKEDIKEC